MRPFVIKPHLRLKGEISFLGDKSIAHRAIIVSALTRGKTTIKNFPANKDCLRTLRAFQKLGIRTKVSLARTVTVFGKGLHGLSASHAPISAGESGTTLRLLLGVLAGQDFKTKLVASPSLSHRPMLRVTEPLRLMGAKIYGQTGKCRLRTAPRQRRRRANGQREEYPPIVIQGGNLRPIKYRMPLASAQVKSAILLAGLYAKGTTKIIEPLKSRDHTERMLKLFKADIKLSRNNIVIKGGRELTSPKRIYIPGDISSASFFMIATAILPDSLLIIKNVNLNPSRIGIINVLRRMETNIKIRYLSPNTYRLTPNVKNYEPAGDIIVKSSKLKGAIIKREEIPFLIDEIPILMVAACFACGRTIFEGAGELRVKETDRIRSMSENLKKMGANISLSKVNAVERIIIKGVKHLEGTKVRSFGDHRTAMSMVAAGLAAEGKTTIDDISCINKSFPGFISALKKLIA